MRIKISEKNIENAKSIGVNAIKFENNKQAIKELNEIVGSEK